MTVTVYSKPDCVQCTATKRHLDGKQIPFVSVDLTEDDEAMALVTSLGYRQVPVIIAGERHWAGYQPSHLNAITEAEMAGAAAEPAPSL